MAENSLKSESRGGKRCVARGCSKSYRDGDVSLHYFPKDPEILRQWNKFVKTKRKDWKGPTAYSVLCSQHFDVSAYPAKYRFMEAMGQVATKKQLNPGAVPTKHSETSNQGADKRTADIPVTPCIASKRTRRVYQKREAERIMSQCSQKINLDVQGVVETDNLSSDHNLQNTESYEALKRTVSVGTQLSIIKPSWKSDFTQTKLSLKNKGVQVNTTMKDVTVSCNLLLAPPLMKLGHENVSSSCDSSSSCLYSDCESEDVDYDSDDVLYTEDELDESDESCESYESEHNEQGNQKRKFIVNEEELINLFTSCPLCASPTSGEIQQTRGTFIAIFQECGVCGLQRTWRNQPSLGSIYAGNVEFSSAILFSGSLPSKVIRLFKFLNLATISIRTYMYHQQYYLHPAILQVWKSQQNDYFEEVLKNGFAVKLGGDGRADTPGHCAMFGSYSLMDLERNKIVESQLVQSNEVGSSYQMEKEGLVRAVKIFNKNEIIISQLVTDRHLQVGKWVRENMPRTTHYVDVWHVAKGLKKKLVALSNEKDCSDIGGWIKSITNHLYWVPSALSEGDVSNVTWEKWTSVFRHIQNIHDGHGDHYLKCEHEELDPNDRQKRWLRPGTKVVEKLEGIIYSRQMKKDIGMLSPHLQTSNLEAYHSTLNHFAPKMFKFSYRGMQSRLILAALHFNENSQRTQASSKGNQLRYKIAFPKQKKGDYTVRKVMTKNTYEYVFTLMEEVMSRVQGGQKQHQNDVGSMPGPLCERYNHPDKTMAVQSLFTRFQPN